MQMFEQLPFGSIVLIDDSLRLLFQQSLLKEKKGLFGVSFLSLSAWMKQLHPSEGISKEQTLFSYRRLLREHSASFPIFSLQFNDHSFLQQCADFLGECKTSNADLKLLPERNENEKELKRILQLLEPLPHPADEQIKAMETLCLLEDCSHIFIYPSFFTLTQQKAVDLLIERGARYLDREQACTQMEFYHAVNMRQEIEGIAQQIIERKADSEDISICVLDPFYEQLCEQIFNRYNIPYTILSASATDTLLMQMQTCLQYFFDSCFDHQQALLSCGIFTSECDALARYLKHFSLDLRDRIIPRTADLTAGPLFDDYSISRLQQLEQQAIEQQEAISPILEKAIELTPQEILAYVCELFASRYPSPSFEQIRIMNKIQDLFAKVYEWILSKDDLGFLCQLLKNLQFSQGANELCGVVIHNRKQLHFERKIRYICGATMKAWPGFQAESGIFDEHYREALPLATMEARYQHHTAQCERYFNAQTQLIVTYPAGSYEGKANEASLEIEQLMHNRQVKEQALLLNATHSYVMRNHVLNASLARRLYLKNNELKGSVSSLERYRQCPFSYFLRYGLHLKKQKNDIDNAKIGSLAHQLLQELCETYGKAYVETSAQDLEKRISSELTALHLLYPDRKKELEQLQKRLIAQMEALLQMLSSLEEHNHLTPRFQEQPFQYSLALPARKLCMNGVIDRVDASNHMAVVLDYKSSKKTLSNAKVSSGLQMQLLTYAIVLLEDEQGAFKDIKEVLGAFYISMKQETTTQPAMKINRVKKECTVTDTDMMLDELKKKQRLSGWIFSTDIDLFDDNAEHVANLKYTKDGVVPRDKNSLRSLELLQKGMKNILVYLAMRILDGKIECEPCEGACDFCEFHSICRYHGQPLLKEAIIDDQGEYCISQPTARKEKDNAEME